VVSIDSSGYQNENFPSCMRYVGARFIKVIISIGSRFVFPLGQSTPARFLSSLNINCGFFLHGRTSGRFTSVTSSTRTSEPPAEPVPGPAAEPWWNLIRYFSVFPLCGACLGLFRVLVLCRKPSFRSFFFGVSVSFDILPIYGGLTQASIRGITFIDSLPFR